VVNDMERRTAITKGKPRNDNPVRRRSARDITAITIAVIAAAGHSRTHRAGL
jgi:hypothetical protein